MKLMTPDELEAELREIGANKSQAAGAALRATEHAIASSNWLAALFVALGVIVLGLAFRMRP